MSFMIVSVNRSPLWKQNAILSALVSLLKLQNIMSYLDHRHIRIILSIFSACNSMLRKPRFNMIWIPMCGLSAHFYMKSLTFCHWNFFFFYVKRCQLKCQTGACVVVLSKVSLSASVNTVWAKISLERWMIILQMSFFYLYFSTAAMSLLYSTHTLLLTRMHP